MHNPELVAAAFALKIWGHYLCEVRYEIYTDHKVQVHFHPNRVEKRQRSWLEFLKDYDMEIKYPPEKTNVGIDALSRKSIRSFAYLLIQEKKLLKEFEVLHVEIVLHGHKGYLAALQVASPLVDGIKKQ